MDRGLGFTAAIITLLIIGIDKPSAGVLAGLVGLVVKWVVGNVVAARRTSAAAVGDDEQRLRSEIEAPKTRCQSRDAEYNATNLFGLGCLCAELFDVTRSDAHRSAALKYMSKAAELEPAQAKVDSTFGVGSSSLFEQPEFRRFVE